LDPGAKPQEPELIDSRVVWEAGVMLRFGWYLGYPSLNSPDSQQLDALLDLQTMLSRKGQAKHRLQPPKTAAGHPVTCTGSCSCGQHLGGPLRVFWSGNQFFSFFPSFKQGRQQPD